MISNDHLTVGQFISSFNSFANQADPFVWRLLVINRLVQQNPKGCEKEEKKILQSQIKIVYFVDRFGSIFFVYTMTVYNGRCNGRMCFITVF